MINVLPDPLTNTRSAPHHLHGHPNRYLQQTAGLLLARRPATPPHSQAP
jgi:hypothetical protein